MSQCAKSGAGTGRLATLPILVVLALVCWLWPSAAKANPDLRMRTLETEHFHVHYYAGEEEVADRVAMLAERAYRRVTRLMGHEPFLKTHITLEDDTDVSNGFANAVPYPQIRLFAPAPGSMSVLGNYDDWLDILVTHEFVHVVHIDTVHGLPRLINALLGFGVVGKSSAPNILQPRWIIEGLATMYESDLGTAGRHRSALFDMFIRMAVLEGRFQRIDQATNNAKIFPHSSSVYLYGLHLMHYLANRYGREKIAELSHVYAGRIIPFGINRALEDVIGIDFDQLWKEYRLDTTRRFRSQARQIRARGVRQGRRLTFAVSDSSSGAHTRYPIWSPDDRWVYYFEDDGHRQPGLYRVPAEGAPVREGLGIGREGMQKGVENVLQFQDGGRASFVGASSDLVFDMLGTHDYRYRWSDLYRWSGGDPREREQLTFGLRARDPSVSPDGRTVAFARNDTGQSRLAFLDLATKDVVEVEPSEAVQQVYNPNWAPDGERVAYSSWREGGYRDIYVYDRRTEKTERVTADRYMDQNPTWTPDGRYIVFSSDRSGVFNLYAYDTETTEVWMVTNVFGGAFEPSVSRDGRRVAYVGYTTNGFDVWVMDWDPERFLVAPPVVHPAPSARDSTPELAEARGRPPSALHSHRYRALQTFFPRTIFPTALEFESSDFLTSLGAVTEFADIMGFHSAVVSFAYLTDLRRSAGSLSYSFNRLIPNFDFGFGRSYRQQGGFTRYVYDSLEGTGDASNSYRQDGYLERATSLRAGFDVPVVRHPRHQATAGADYRFVRYENVDSSLQLVDPNAPASNLPEVGDIAQVDLTLSYDSMSPNFRYVYGDGVGRRVTATMSIVDQRLGGDFGDLQVEGFYTEMIPMPWRGHQVLALKLSGGASARGLGRRSAYFVGGFSQQQDQIRNLLVRNAWSEAGVLRGYPRSAFDGRYYAVLNAEYRVPVVDVDRGFGALPVLFERIVVAGFTDWGQAWSGAFTLKDLAGSVGASLIWGLRVGYGERINLMLQYAHGFDEEVGIDYFRAIVARSF